VARAREWLGSDAAELVLVHLVDLDKASHSPGPKSERYAREVRDANAALAQIAALLGPADSLIVAGDHGHDEHGNHTPDPGYLALGPAFAPGRVDIEQATVALLLSAATATPLPPAYDGEVPASALSRPVGGSREREAEVRRVVRQGREGRRSLLRSQTLQFLPGLALAALALGALFPAGRRRLTAALVLLTTAISVALGFGWASVFRAAFWLGPTSNLLNYLGLFALVGAAVAYAARRGLRLGWAEAVASALLAVPLLVHFTGDDYFASPRMLTRLFPAAVLLVLFENVRRRERSSWLGVGASVCAAVLCELRAPASEGVLSLLLVAFAALVLYLLAPSTRPRARLLLALTPFVLALPMRHAGWSTLVLSLLAVAVLAVTRERRLPAPLQGLVVAAAVIVGFWASLGSLRFDRVRFEFALAWLPTLPNEALLAVLVTPLTILKYALVVFLPLSLSRLAREPELGESTAFFSALPALSATAFVAGATAAGGSRYHETAIQEASLYAVVALLTFAVLALSARKAAPAAPPLPAPVAASPPTP
jgi:hypothetical protein